VIGQLNIRAIQTGSMPVAGVLRACVPCLRFKMPLLPLSFLFEN